MKVGVSLTSFHATRDVRAGARMMVERAAAAWASGLDSLFIGDHHVMPAPYYQNVPMLGRLLAEWGDRPAGCLFLLPLWNPVLAAEQIGTLASLAQGKFVLQCAIGEGESQFASLGVPIRQRPSRFEESLGIIRGLLAGETVQGTPRYPFPRARVNPVTPEPLEVWIGGSAEPSVDRAARLGDGFLAGPELTPEQAAHWAAFYRERCARHGRAPGVVAIRRDIYVGESDAAAARVAEPIVAAGYRGHHPSASTWGSPETVAKRFRDYAALGYTDVIIRHLTDEQELVLGSMSRLEEVRRAVLDA